MSEPKEEVQQDNFFENINIDEYLNQFSDVLDISNPKFRVNSGTKAGDNNIGIINRVFIEGEKDNVLVKFVAILKIAPEDEIVRRIYKTRTFFSREHLFYSDILPTIKKFLKEKNNDIEYIPKCYFSSDVDCKEVVCLEDLRPQGFVMRDRMKQMDFPHLKLALSVLGRFHAVSFALRDQRPEIFASKIGTLKETLFRPEVIGHDTFIDRFGTLAELAKISLADEDPKYTERFSEYMKTALNMMEWCCDGKNAEPYAVLGHGDFWTNNMLFKYDEDCPDPKEICFLDFQLSRYASSVLDLSYVFFCSTSQEVRERHYDELIKIYHDSLSDYLSKLGSDPKKLFPFDALVDQLKKFSVYAAGMTLLALPTFTTQGEDIQRTITENGDLLQLTERIHRDHFWRNTMRDNFKDLIDRNYI